MSTRLAIPGSARFVGHDTFIDLGVTPTRVLRFPNGVTLEFAEDLDQATRAEIIRRCRSSSADDESLRAAADAALTACENYLDRPVPDVTAEAAATRAYLATTPPDATAVAQAQAATGAFLALPSPTASDVVAQVQLLSRVFLADPSFSNDAQLRVVSTALLAAGDANTAQVRLLTRMVRFLVRMAVGRHR